MELQSLFTINLILEFIAGILGIISFILVYPLWLTYKKALFFGLTCWTSVLTSITFFHVFLDITSFLLPFEPLPPSSWIAYSYLPERILDSVILYFAVYPSHLKSYVANTVLMLFVSFMVVFMIVDPIATQHETALIGRPQEMFQILPAAFVLGSFIDVVKPVTRRLSFALLTTLIGGLVMGLSHQLYDFWFNTAHIAKVCTYSIILYVIIWIRHTIRAFSHGDKDIYGH